MSVCGVSTFLSTSRFPLIFFACIYHQRPLHIVFNALCIIPLRSKRYFMYLFSISHAINSTPLHLFLAIAASARKSRYLPIKLTIDHCNQALSEPTLASSETLSAHSKTPPKVARTTSSAMNIPSSSTNPARQCQKYIISFLLSTPHVRPPIPPFNPSLCPFPLSHINRPPPDLLPMH